MQHKRLGQVDLVTGEILEDGQLVYLPAKRRNGFQHGGFMTVANVAAGKLAQMKLGAQANRVLFMLLAKLDYGNWINITQTEIAEELDMQPSHVSRAMKRLADEGILEIGPGEGTRKTYRLSPYYAWKGSAKSHREELNARTKSTTLTLVHGQK